MDVLTKIYSLGGALLQAAAIIWLIVSFVKSESGIEGKKVNRLSLGVGMAYGLVFLRDAAAYFIPAVPGPWGVIAVSIGGGLIMGGLAGLTASGFQKGKTELVEGYAAANAQARAKAGLSAEGRVMSEAAQVVRDSAASVAAVSGAAAQMITAAAQSGECPPEDLPASPEEPFAPTEDPDDFIKVRGLFSTPRAPGGFIESGELFGGSPVITRTPVQIEE